ncbi:DUF2142 domain-containing protein [Lactococcus sp.]|uniref:DUF2142 domain-containing protein n=1 Tax=Lactococcus sp. TaxID=44273 RepID=UPI0035AF2757
MNYNKITLPRNKRKKTKVEKVFIRLALIFGILTVFIQPLFSAPDEYLHFSVAYNVFHTSTNEFYKDGNTLSAINEKSNGYITVYQEGSWYKYYFKDKAPYTDSQKLTVHLNISNISRLPQAIGILIATLIYPSWGLMFIFGRLANLLFYSFALYFCIKKAKFGKWPMAAVGLLPISIQQAASMNYDAATYVAVFAVFSLMTNLWTRKEKLDLRWIIYSILVLLLLLVPKASVLVVGIFFVTLPTHLFGDNVFTRLLDKFWDLCSRFKWLVAIVILGAFGLYLKYEFAHYGGLVQGTQILFNTFFRPDIYTNLDNVLVTGMIGNFGQMTYRLPEWLIVFDFIFLFILMTREKEVTLDTRVAVSGVIAFMANILMTAVAVYITWTVPKLPGYLPMMVSLGNQGRYYTPLLILLIPVGIYLNKYIKVEMSDKSTHRMFNFMIIFNLIYFLFLTIMYYYTKDLGRNIILETVQNLRHLF